MQENEEYMSQDFQVIGSRCITPCPHIPNISVGSNGCKSCSWNLGVIRHTSIRPAHVKCGYFFNTKRQDTSIKPDKSSLKSIDEAIAKVKDVLTILETIKKESK